jgi:hypothetical protein
VLDAHLLASVRLKTRRRTISSNDTLSIWFYQASNCKMVRRTAELGSATCTRCHGERAICSCDTFWIKGKRPLEMLCSDAIVVINSSNRTAEEKKRLRK